MSSGRPPFEFEAPPRQRSRPSNAAPGPWGLMLIGLCGAGLLTFIAGQLIGDLTIAFTLVACIFAAIGSAGFTAPASSSMSPWPSWPTACGG